MSSEVIPDDILKHENLNKVDFSIGQYMIVNIGVTLLAISKWRDIGSQLGFSAQELEDINNFQLLYTFFIYAEAVAQVVATQRTVEAALASYVINSKKGNSQRWMWKCCTILTVI